MTDGEKGSFLKVVEGNAAGSLIQIEDELVVGRASTVTGRLADDPELSRRHARIAVVGPEHQLTIEDLGSTNGTMVNGQSISGSQRLLPGDRIKVGQTVMVVTDASGRDFEATALSSVPVFGPTEPQQSAVRTDPDVEGARVPPTAPVASAGATPPADRSGHRRPSLVAAAAVVAIGAAAVIVIASGGGSKTLTEEQVVSQMKPSVVSITDRVGQNVFGGSGIVLDAKRGLILTNAHVVSGAVALKVGTVGQASIPAQIVAQAPCDDLAVLRLTVVPPGIRSAPLGNSADVKAGENVTVLGFPESIDESSAAPKLASSSGTVSQPDHSASLGSGSPKYPSLIQHQAFVNHGDSGGPLVDGKGNVVGINTLTAAGAGSGQIQGQYEAITISHAKELLGRLTSGRSVANLGWNLVPINQQLLTADFGSKLGGLVADYLYKVGETRGLVVRGVDPGSAASKAHFGAGDYITAIDGTPITSVQDVCDVAESARSKSTIRLDGRYLADALANHKRIGDPFSQDLIVP